LSNKQKKSKYLAAVGGQALMEGIMMSGPKGAAMSLRLPDGTIETTPKKMKRLKDKYKILGKPFIRGPISFVESMVFGYKCIMESAEKTSLDLTVDEGEKQSKLDKWLTDHFGKKMMTVIGVISIIIGLFISFGLFMWLPSLLFDEVAVKLLHVNVMWKALIEGVVRIILFVTYMSLVSRMKEMNRLFMYHGAEHKAIFCVEADLPLTVENVRAQKRFHPRCGTSFIFVTIILSILVSSVISIVFAGTPLVDKRPIWMAVKFLLLPLIMSVGYEFNRLAGMHDNKLLSLLAAPGLLMQRITTKEPPDDIIEVGIAALKAVIDEPDEADAAVDMTEFSAETAREAAVPETEEPEM